MGLRALLDFFKHHHEWDDTGNYVCTRDGNFAEQTCFCKESRWEKYGENVKVYIEEQEDYPIG